MMRNDEYEKNWESRATEETLEEADESTVKSFYESAAGAQS